MSKRVFVTVGSTSFDALTLVALSESFLRHLQAHGYTGISIQHGRSGQPLPQTPHMDDFDIEVFDYAPSLASEMRSADLIISHAGAGSILESLKLGKPLIVVANETLMDNHQLELAQKLSADGYCISAKPSTLHDAIRLVGDTNLKSLPQSNGHALDKIIKEEMTHL